MEFWQIIITIIVINLVVMNFIFFMLLFFCIPLHDNKRFYRFLDWVIGHRWCYILFIPIALWLNVMMHGMDDNERNILKRSIK